MVAPFKIGDRVRMTEAHKKVLSINGRRDAGFWKWTTGDYAVTRVENYVRPEDPDYNKTWCYKIEGCEILWGAPVWEFAYGPW